MKFVNQLLDIPSTDPDDARRRKLLNILLAGIVPLTVLTLLATLISDIADLYDQERIVILYIACFVLLAGFVIIFLINRYGSGLLAGSLFLLSINAVVAFGDEPQEVALGRSLLLLAVPIIMASVLLPPYASFIAAGLNSLVITIFALNLQLVPSPYAMLVFFVVALVSWLAARSLEHALRDLRTLNLELDQRVRDRTRELSEALGRNQAILEGIADGVIVFDNYGKAILTNPAIAGLLDRPADKVVGHRIETLMAGNVGAEDQEMVLDLLDQEMYTPGTRIEWGAKTLSASVAPVRLSAGEMIGTVAVFRDFTREAEIERMKSVFVSMASHELRTPLNAILGYADMLQAGACGPLSDEQQGAVGRVMANAGELLGLVNNLLDQAQIEAGTLTLNVTSFEPAGLIDDVAGVMDVLARSQGLDLVSHIAPDVPAALSSDRQRLRQILINLVGNSIKFTDEGSVQIRLYRPDATHWALEVSDTGCGIPPEAQEYIFDPFRQVDDPTTRRRTGAGLGLSITKQLVTLMGGEISLASQVGHGSTFTVVLPLAPIRGEIP